MNDPALPVIDRFRVDGKVAIVTGAGRGIGAASAIALAEAGADLVIGARSADELNQVATTVQAAGRRCRVVPGDLSERQSMARLVDVAADEFGAIDIIVNNVGGAMPRAFSDLTEAEFTAALHFNVTTAFNLTQLALPLLKEHGGTVVNIGSVSGRESSRGFAAYGTAKAALMHLTGAMAQDLAPRIRVNTVSPGATATSALDVVTSTPALHDALVANIALGRLGDPTDIAAAVLYLASEASAFVTGQTLEVAGGVQGAGLDLGIPDV